MSEGVDISKVLGEEKGSQEATQEPTMTPIGDVNDQMMEFLEDADPMAASFLKAISDLSARCSQIEMNTMYMHSKMEIMEKHLSYLISKDPVLAKEIEKMRTEMDAVDNQGVSEVLGDDQEG